MLGIGEKLRNARIKQNLSLRELASMTDVSASLLSQIENEKANPSVRTLHSLADALALPVDYFFPERKQDISRSEEHASAVRSSLTASQARMQQVAAALEDESDVQALLPGEGPTESPILRARDRPTIELQGNVTWARLTPDKEQDLEFMEICYAPGASSGARMSHHKGREFVLVLSGMLTLELGFEVYTLNVGDSTLFDSETPHRLSNSGDQSMRALSVILQQ